MNVKTSRLEIKDGTGFATPSHAVATFAVAGNHSSSSSGDSVMYPVF